MSVQYGIWNQDGRPVDSDRVAKARAQLAPHGPDDWGSYQSGNISILYHALHTTKESRREKQPHATSSGRVITWDGRLDNRDQLIPDCGGVLTAVATDVEVVAAAYQLWGTHCFAKLIGDWAVSIWDPADRSLILAKDPIGTRHLHYLLDKNEVTWSTTLDALLLLSEKSFQLEEEYIAGWFSCFPAAHLTPYVGMHSVPPSSFLLIRAQNRSIRKYRDFDPDRRILCRTDAEYEEQFRNVFTESVRRRLRSDSPVLAELSGGMDSSSIVCVADRIIVSGAAETPRLDTISYYDDSEPNWNERPYFMKIEQGRGRAGCHIDVGSKNCLPFDFERERFAVSPGSQAGRNQAAKQFEAYVASQRNSVVLSGVGGDEVAGGVPTPTPELQDLLVRARLKALARKLKAWSLDKRKPWFFLLAEAVRDFLPQFLLDPPKHKRIPSWLNSEFIKRHRAVLSGYEKRLRLVGPRPSFQHSLITLDVLRRQLACSILPASIAYEKCYPYLDRDFLEFLYAIPREQLVRPGHRRSLMRRALVGIVPDEILNRRRKAFVARASLAAVSAGWATLIEAKHGLLNHSLGIIDTNLLTDELRKAEKGAGVPIVPLMRTICIEAWLRTATSAGVLRAETRRFSFPAS